MNCCLVIDISKISLKIMSITLKEDKIVIQEIHRCSKITTMDINSQTHLNIDKIVKEIKQSLINIKQIGYKIECISVNSSISTPIFLDENNELIKELCVDQSIRTRYYNRVINELGSAYIYRKTGVSFSDNSVICRILMYNDIYSREFGRVRKMVSISDYIGYALTDSLYNEKSQLALSQLFNFNTQDVDRDILEYLGVYDRIEFDIIPYGSIIGNCKITGAYVISPYGNNFLSSLFTAGITNMNSIFIVNSNEGIIGCTENLSKMYLEGVKFNLNHQLFNRDIVKLFKYIPCYKLVDGFLKNVDNNFMVENVWNIVDGCNNIDYIIDFDSEIFKNSTILMNIIKYYFDFKLNSMPNSISDFIRIVYNSFAVYYKKCVRDFEKITGGIFDSICLVGDHSSNNAYNQFISDITFKDVEIGPRDSGVIGNAINQLLSIGIINNLDYANSILRNSFDYTRFKYSGKKFSYQYIENII